MENLFIVNDKIIWLNGYISKSIFIKEIRITSLSEDLEFFLDILSSQFLAIYKVAKSYDFGVMCYAYNRSFGKL